MKQIFTLTALILTSLLANAQDEHFIYGRIVMTDNKTYEGPIRWGKEEVYWNDIFNAGKPKNRNLRYLSDDQRNDLIDRRYRSYNVDGEWGNWTRWFGNNSWHWDSDGNDFTHQFSCQFGDIKSISPSGSKWVDIELRNGMRFELSGDGYNDVGLDIRVIDRELGEVEIFWNRIAKIEFVNTPSKLMNRFGKPLYGTVESFGKKFTGYIQWDHDERLSVDKLNGDSDDGDNLAIEFDKIAAITRVGNRCRVKLKSGREIYMEGSNDVNRENRGVIVMNRDMPAIDIPWDEFDKITFEDKAPTALVSYDQFKDQKELSATVKTFNGETYSGKIVYDLDEEFDFELLQGKQHDFEYTTAFRNVKKIKTYDDTRCEIELKNGEKLMLSDSQDVNGKNQGILVFASDKQDPQYVPWHKVSEIEFR